MLKSTYGDEITNDLPTCIMDGNHTVTDKAAILNHFNEHFVSSGHLFESLHPSSQQSCEQDVQLPTPPSTLMTQPFSLLM